MSVQTNVTSSPAIDANGKTTLGGTLTIVSSDNGDGFHSAPVTYTNADGVLCIDTRGTTYSPVHTQTATVTTTMQEVNRDTSEIVNGFPSNAFNPNVANVPVTVVDTRPKPPVDQVAVPNNMPITVERGSTLG